MAYEAMFATVSSHDDGDDDYMVAALAVSDASGAILHCFSPRTGGGEWIKKTLVGRAPPLATTPQWRTDRVLCLDGKIWWINLSQGILSCDPRSPAGSILRSVPFPNLRPAARTPRAPFDEVAGSFCDAFDRAIMDMEFHQFTRTAVAYLNKDIAKEVTRSTIISHAYGTIPRMIQ
jgi:hypothetical protein